MKRTFSRRREATEFRAVIDCAPSCCDVHLLIHVAPSSVYRFHRENIGIVPRRHLLSLKVYIYQKLFNFIDAFSYKQKLKAIVRCVRRIRRLISYSFNVLTVTGLKYHFLSQRFSQLIEKITQRCAGGNDTVPV